MTAVAATAAPNRLAGAPAELLEPAERPTLEAALRWCKSLAESHYENFHVATTLLPKQLRPHFHAVYAFCRVSDDLGDEVPDRAVATHLLETWRTMLVECYQHPERSRHPVFVALQPSIQASDLPIEPFVRLIRAFLQDQVRTRFADMCELEDYSSDSANPVGELVLRLCGYTDEHRIALSNSTCTGLQLANFWQDVREDLLERDRVYLPKNLMAAHGVSESMLRAGTATPQYRALLRELVEDARQRLLQGAPLIDQVDRQLSGTLRLFTAGGLAILRAIQRQNFATLERRPSISSSEKFLLLCGAATGKLGLHRGLRGLR